MTPLFVIKFTYNNPEPRVSYLGDWYACNATLGKARRFPKEEAERIAGFKSLAWLNPEVVPVKS